MFNVQLHIITKITDEIDQDESKDDVVLLQISVKHLYQPA